MLVIQSDKNKYINEVEISLTQEQLEQFRGYIKDLIDNPKLHHVHFNSKDYRREIVLSIFEIEHLDDFEEGLKSKINSIYYADSNENYQ